MVVRRRDDIHRRQNEEQVVHEDLHGAADKAMFRIQQEGRQVRHVLRATPDVLRVLKSSFQ